MGKINEGGRTFRSTKRIGKVPTVGTYEFDEWKKNHPDEYKEWIENRHKTKERDNAIAQAHAQRKEIENGVRDAFQQMRNLSSRRKPIAPDDTESMNLLGKKLIGKTNDMSYDEKMKYNSDFLNRAKEKGLAIQKRDGEESVIVKPIRRPRIQTGEPVKIEEKRINENQNEENEVPFYTFLSHIKKFLANLLKEPSKTQVDDYLKELGITKTTLIKKLMDEPKYRETRKVLIRKEKVDDKDKKAQFSIKYSVIKHNFEKKIKRLHSELFEKNMPSKINEDGEGGDVGAIEGSTNASISGNADTPIMPLGNVQRRKIFRFSESQINRIKKMIDETTTTATLGNYQYDAPLSISKKDPSMKHRSKNGGISVETIK